MGCLKLAYYEKNLSQRRPLRKIEESENTCVSLLYFGARYYNSDISVWLSVDPMSDERPGLSPYNYCQWNPVMRIDPTGMLDKGDDWVEREDGSVYWNDKVTSKNDKDLNGETYIGKVYRRFENIGNTHFDDVTYNSDKSITTTHRERPDIDGFLTRNEAYEWYHYGQGQPLTVDLGKINFKSSYLSVDDFNGVGSVILVDFFRIPNQYVFDPRTVKRRASDRNLSDIYGRVHLMLLDANKGIVVGGLKGNKLDEFNFSAVGDLVANKLYPNGDPQDFVIKYCGFGKIRINNSSNGADYDRINDFR